MNSDYIPVMERFCRKCGKAFIPAPQHVYVQKGGRAQGMYCSWTCFNHRDDGKLQKPRKNVAQYDKDGLLIRVYPSVSDALTAVFKGTKGSENGIRTAIKNGVSYLGYYWKYVNNQS